MPTSSSILRLTIPVIGIPAKTFGLMAMDGAHMAVMEAHGLTDLASNNSHFKRVPWIKLYQP